MVFIIYEIKKRPSLTIMSGTSVTRGATLIELQYFCLSTQQSLTWTIRTQLITNFISVHLVLSGTDYVIGFRHVAPRCLSKWYL